ncbi:cbb3-type cytochrome c oxidase subunit I [Persicimonas caeni]|uniref:Cbb3-type cytochrome c oxidase subunit I n=1 Tax=Persicimonas caeni TaxID=2292766 RepID=A0A4Y6PPM2_PERCE|nr:cbb3-type cytochrome c oxidase subunit I [Persicimonas caeni]QDG50163.1 cbb3-type cytochrome c oxidase subunit I [Persicimonas caeni]QED31384.1 cbb3-type cytochrome c oxidase subunit I [Persicimonas caeni]
MPSISYWAIRLALIHLGLGLTAGALMLAHKGYPFLPHFDRWLTAHFHTMLFGWTVQLVIGVGYWILPKFRGGTSRGNDALAIAAIVLVNVGTLMGAGFALYGVAATVAFALQAGAAVCFAVHLWPRVKAFGA